MLEQTIPFFCILFFLIVNIIIKKKFFCISTLSLLYVALAFGGSVFLHLKPRTGDPFVDLEAMIFLGFCMSCLCLPALFFDDYSTKPLLEPANQTMKSMAKWLILFTVPVSIFFLIRSLPSLAFYLSSAKDISRETFREDLDFAKGMDNPGMFFLMLFGCMDFVAIFFGVYFLLHVKNSKDYFMVFLLFLGGFALCIDSLKAVARGATYYIATFIGIAMLILSRYAEPAQRKKLLKISSMMLLCLLIPFTLITIARFKSDILYAVGSYFSTGPYSFNTDYVANTHYDLPSMKGLLTIGLFTFLCDKLFGTDFYTQGNNNVEALMREQGEAYWTYNSVSGAYSGEFRTVIGTFLIDISAVYAVCLSIFLSCFYIFFFCKGRKKQKLSTNIFGVIYFYILINAPIGGVFLGKTGNMQLIYLLLFVCLISYYEKWEERRSLKKCCLTVPQNK